MNSFKITKGTFSEVIVPVVLILLVIAGTAYFTSGPLPTWQEVK